MKAKSVLHSKVARRSLKGWPHEPLARVVAPIVEGQIRSFVNDHPEMIKLAKGQTRDQFVMSLAKRIINDLTCGSVTARLTAALVYERGAAGSSEGAAKVALAAGDAGPDSLASPVSNSEQSEAA